jgi:DNA-binding response OmpR family regulator
MHRVLLIDDDRALIEVLTLALQDAGYAVDAAYDGVAGLRALPTADVVISDVVMPGLDGLTLCRRAREAGHAVPIVLLTSRDDEVDEALGLELGADDYVAKPFSTRVLLARVAALLRRDASRKGPPTAATKTGHLALDAERLEARWRDVAIVTTVTEFRMLEVLARRPGVVFSRERLLEQVRGDDSVVAERIVDTYIKRLRRKLEAIDAGFDRIETVVGAGYRWKS